MKNNYYKSIQNYLKAEELKEIKSKLFNKSIKYYSKINNYDKILNYYLNIYKNENDKIYYLLGKLYENGIGIDINYKSIKYYLKSIELGNNNNSEEYYNIGYLYENGLGIKKNIDKSIKFYLKSFELGNIKSKKKIKKMRKKGLINEEYNNNNINIELFTKKRKINKKIEICYLLYKNKKHNITL